MRFTFFSALVLACTFLITGCGNDGYSKPKEKPEGNLPIAEIEFNDPEFASCVLDAASANGWELNKEVTSLNCSHRLIRDVSEVTNFVSITSLNLAFTSITELDVTNLDYLEELVLTWAPVTALDIDQNSQLARISLAYSNVTELNFRRNAKLTYINLEGTGFRSLDVSNNKELVTLVLNYSRISSLNVDANKKLAWLYISGAPLTSEACEYVRALDGSNGLSVSTDC